ncbi:MAG: alpha/beta hydrolase [Mycobacteriales bacterium]
MSADLEVLHTPGDGLPVVLLHGICHGAWCWADTYVPFFSSLGHDVHALSLRGHAGSPGLERLHEAGLDDYADDLLGVLPELPETAVVVGHSMGGAIVQLAARRAPQLFRGAVLLAPMVPGGSTPRETLRTFRSPAGTAALARLLAGRTLSARAANRLPFFDGRLSADRAARAAASLQAESRRAMADLRSFAPPAGDLGIPLLVVGSRADTIFGAASVTRTARHYGVEPVLLDEGCHDLMLDPSWETSARVIADWITREIEGA